MIAMIAMIAIQRRRFLGAVHQIAPVPIQEVKKKILYSLLYLPGIWATTFGLFCTLRPLSSSIFVAMGLRLMVMNAPISTLIATSGCKSNMLILYQSKKREFSRLYLPFLLRPQNFKQKNKLPKLSTNCQTCH